MGKDAIIMPRKYKREFNVYAIVNDIDDHIYIGSTTTELWHRMSQHRADARKGTKSPLYDLMREYGIDHFSIKRVMSSDAEHIRSDEQKVINLINEDLRLNMKRTSSKDHSNHFDYNEICRVYSETGSQNKTANIIGCSTMTVKKAIRRNNIEIVYPPHTAKRLKKASA